MSKTFALARALLKNGVFDVKAKTKTRSILVWLAAGISMAAMAVFAGVEFGLMFSSGLTQLSVQMTFLAIFFINMFQMIYMFASVFFFSKDTPVLLSMPLSPEEIVGAKLIVVLVSLLPFTLVIGLGSLGGAIWAGALSPLQLLVFGLSLILLPLSEALIMGSLMLIIMRFMPFVRNKDLYNLVIGLLSLVMIMVISLVSMYSGQQAAAEHNMIDLITEHPQFVTMGSNLFFQIPWAVGSILDGNLMDIVLCLLSAAIPLLIFMFCASKLYLPVAMSVQTNTSRKKKVRYSGARHSMLFTCFRNDLRLLMRSPTYLMACIIPAFLMPSLVGLMFLINPMSSDLMEITHSFDIMSLEHAWVYPILLGMGLVLFCGSADSIAPTSISREGQNGLNWMKSIPVSFQTQLNAKLVTAALFSFIPSLIYLIPLHIFLNYPVWMDLLFILACLLMSVPTNQLGLWVDLIHPKLHWSTEQEAVKNNINAVLLVLLDMVIALILAGLVVFLHQHIVILTILLVLLTAGSIVLLSWLIRRTVRKSYE